MFQANEMWQVVLCICRYITTYRTNSSDFVGHQDQISKKFYQLALARSGWGQVWVGFGSSPGQVLGRVWFQVDELAHYNLQGVPEKWTPFVNVASGPSSQPAKITNCRRVTAVDIFLFARFLRSIANDPSHLLLIFQPCAKLVKINQNGVCTSFI